MAKHHPSDRTALSGVVNLDKPAGMTSREAVDVVKRLLYPARTGHAGTLDPLATGVLVVCVGSATRLIEYVQRQPKRYRATFLLGRESPTEDIEGEVTLLPSPPRPALGEIVAATERLTGEILQRPPAYSALRIKGRRAYDLARAGQMVELQPRPIMIHSIEVIAYDYPELVLDIRCGSGTYIRSLGRDLAESLGTAAVMSALRRTEIGAMHCDDACQCDQLHTLDRSAWLQPPAVAVGGLPAVQLADSELTRIRAGQFVAIARERIQRPAEGAEVAAFSSAGELVAILTSRGEGLFGARVNIASGGESKPVQATRAHD